MSVAVVRVDGRLDHVTGYERTAHIGAADAALDTAFSTSGLYTARVTACSMTNMEPSTQRINVTLDGEHAAKLSRLAARVHVNEGTLARSLLSSAIDEADPDPANVAALLDGIDGAFERAVIGRRQAAAGDTLPLDQL